MLGEPFITLNSITSITPLGNISPPGHTIPTEHVYINVAAPATGERTIPLTSPGQIWITHISGGPGGDYGGSTDYSVHFAVCEDVFGYFGHLDELSPSLLKIIDDLGCPAEAQAGTRDCSVEVLEPIDASAPLGTVRTVGNFDLGIWDVRQERFAVNPERYAGRSLFMQCPLIYFAESLSDRFLELLEGEGDARCGQVSYDVAGALQGNWFLKGAEEEDRSVFFGYDNLEPGSGVVAVSGGLTEPGRMEFTPATSGSINRRFDEVTADGNVYCYERDGTGRHESYTSPGNLLEGHVLAQVIGDAEARVAHGDGPCPVSPSMDNALTYVR